MKKIIIVLILLLSFNVLAQELDLNKSHISIIQVVPKYYQHNVQVDIVASNSGALDGNIEIYFIFKKEEKRETQVIPAFQIRQFTYTLENPVEGTLEVYAISDENKSCFIKIDPANEMLDYQCSNEDLRQTRKVEEKSFMEKYFGENWQLIFIGLIVFIIIVFIAYKVFSREKTEIEKQLESGRKLLKELEHLKKWRAKKGEEEKKEDKN